jgi:hypothetical protein
MSASGRQTGPDFATPYDEPVESVSSADAVRRKAEAPEIPSIDRVAQESLDRYADHSRRMPQREDYKPSLGRKILGTAIGALAGYGRPEVAAGMTDRIVNAKYRNATSDWEREGEELKDVAPLYAAEEQRRLSERGQDVTQRGQDVGFEETGIREKGVESRFIRNEEGEERRSKRSATTAAEGEKGANTRAAEGEAGKNARAASAQAGANARAARVKVGEPLSPTAIRSAQTMAKGDVYNDHPEWRKFYEEDPATGRISIKPDPEAEDNWFSADKPAGWGSDKAEHEKFKIELAKREHEYTTRRKASEDNTVEELYNFD